MKKCYKLLLFLIVSSVTQAQTFVIRDSIISDTTQSLTDPEIDWYGHNFAWAGPEGIWIGKIDSITGDFIPRNGKGLLVDSTPSFRGMQLVANGPEWAMSKDGSEVIYPDSATTESKFKIGRISLVNNQWTQVAIPGNMNRIPFFASFDTSYNHGGITSAGVDPITLNGTGKILRFTNSATSEINIGNNLDGGRWIKGIEGVTLLKTINGVTQAGVYIMSQPGFVQVTTNSYQKEQAWAFRSPEYNNDYILCCVEKKPDFDELGIYRRLNGNWTKIDSIASPSDRKEIFSPEPFWFNNQSYFFMVTKIRVGQPTSLYDQVWIVGLDPNNRIQRMVSEAKTANRTDPEVFYTNSEPVIYYTERRAGINIIHKCATGLANTTIIERFATMTFTKDYFPGTNDINGKELGSTETMNIIKHKGKLFSAMGNWMDYPVRPDSHGAQILRKDSFNQPWVVDTSFGQRYLRTEAIMSATFTKDFMGNILSSPVNLLVAGANDISIDRQRRLSVFVRNDVTSKWLENIAFIIQSGGAGIRSFAVHTDKVTGKQWLFCGITEGSVIKAGYDVNSAGLLNIDPTKELENLGRVMAMTVCNGDLYAAAGVDVINNGADTVGGLYRRIDGINPSWELVYRWPYTALVSGDEANIMRGITTVPATDGSGRQVLIGTRANPGVVERIEPYNNHQVIREVNIKQYFSKVFSLPYYNGTALSAYNYFYPDTINNIPVWWMSLWVNEPNPQSPTTNGAHFMVRYPDGTYQYQKIYDYNHPVPQGQSLRANRTICKSPFLQDGDSTYYFGGYDCAKDTSRNTSWIYKSTITCTTYTFTGSGNWNVASNWSNNKIPPAILPACAEILINPIGNQECILNVTQTISSGGKITIVAGKFFRVPGNLIVE